MRKLSVVGMVGAVGALASGAYAQGVTDLASAVTEAGTEVSGGFWTVGAGVIALAAAVIGFGLLFRWIKKAVKSS